MSEQGGLSALRERVGRLEVTQDHQRAQLNTNKAEIARLATCSTDHEQRIASIERLLKVTHTVVMWGLASVGTMLLEALTGAIRSFLKLLSVGGSG